MAEAVVFPAHQRHAVELLPTVEALLGRHGVRPDQIAEVYVSGGPGSFTGLRLGITFAKMVALDGAARLVRVPTLGVIAQNALALDPPPPWVAVVLDAKRGHVFAAAFELAAEPVPAYRLAGEAAEVEPGAFLASLPRAAAVLGEGVPYHREAVAASGLVVVPDTHNVARAEVVYRLGHVRARAGRYHDPASLTPIYIRRPEAEEVYERRHGTQLGQAATKP